MRGESNALLFRLGSALESWHISLVLCWWHLLTLWLIQLDKARKSVILSRSIFGGVRDFYGQKFRYDVSIVQDCIFFEQLKPRLQRQVLDSSFKNFYQTFKHIFEDCEIEFQRKIFSSA